MTCSMPGISSPSAACRRSRSGYAAPVTRSPSATCTVWASASAARLLTILAPALLEEWCRRRRFEPRDLLVLVGDQRRPVERRLRHGPAEARGILELAGKARGVDQELLRHAAADHAGAADAIFLGDHRRARRSRAAMRAARTPPEPAPMTNRSTSKSPSERCRHRSCPRFFISARNLLDHFVGKLVAPAAGIGHALVERLRLRRSAFSCRAAIW